MSIFAFICPYQLLTFKKKVTFRQLFSRPGPYDPYVLMDKCPMDHCPYGRLSEWTIVRMDDCPDGRLSSSPQNLPETTIKLD